MASQTALSAANAAVEAHRQAGDALMTTRNNAQSGWLLNLHGLAGTAASITNGEVEKYEAAGFDSRALPAPAQPVGQIQNVKVNFTGKPGYSDVRWKRDPHAEAYVVQRSADPITDTSWIHLETVTEVKFEGNGTTPGQKYWYRVAGVNKLGRGPWSMPAERPVM